MPVATDSGRAPVTRGDADFATKLGQLFETTRDNTGGLYTGKRIAERANSLGYSLSDAYISQLRTGKARTPSFRTVEAIARAFGVSVTFFLTDPDEDSDRAQRQQDYVDLVAQTRSQLAGVDVSKLCPDTIDVMIDVLRMIKSEVAARSTDT